MVYVSQLLGKTVYFEGKPFGKIVDMAIFSNRPFSPISKFEIKRGNKKLTVAPAAIKYEHQQFILKSRQIPLLPYDHNDLYLAEDLIDKQVIDTNGRRIVRVNDIALENNQELKVAGIDVGFFAILRRFGIGVFSRFAKIIPWEYIEAFDYQTGNIKIKLTEKALNSMHPAEIAQILEGVGSKERLGIVAALETKKAAMALEESDNKTQVSILEDLPVNKFKELLNKIRTQRLVDMIGNMHTNKGIDIENALDEEKAKKVKKLLQFPSNVAGGLMQTSFCSFDGQKTVKEVCKYLQDNRKEIDTIIVTNGNGKFIGTIKTRILLFADQLSLLKNILEDRQFVVTDVPIESIIKIIADYNLHALPVVNSERQPIGVITIDDIMHLINQEKSVQEHEHI